jgi:hypothetical protein
MLKLWDAIVECGAILGLILTALGIMVRLIELGEGLKRIGIILGSAILLVMLPAIIVNIWSGLPVWQKLGTMALLGLAVALTLSRRKRSHLQSPVSRRHSH